MSGCELGALSRLSPFEFRNYLMSLAAGRGQRKALDAGRANPNFLAADARHAFFELGRFAMGEAERAGSDLPDGIGGVPARAGIAARLRDFSHRLPTEPGSAALAAMLDFARDRFGFDPDDFVHELAAGVLGCKYPEPVRMLRHAEAVIRDYLSQAVGASCEDGVDLCAVEGAAAGITYVFNTLRQNRLIGAGDTIAIGTPIFSPYLEIPHLSDYRLNQVHIGADPQAGWQYPDSELAKLRDPRVKMLLLVNPGNPTSVKIDATRALRIAEIATTQRPDLIILTDDVYAGFADGFTSLFALCPRNTILLYSFSKYFGATGWRLGVVAVAANNVLDAKLRTAPPPVEQELAERYGPLAPHVRDLKFIDRLIADSRAVALNHTAGLSTPQQVQMTLFALSALMDSSGRYRQRVTKLVRDRHASLYEALGIPPADDPSTVFYYTLVDFVGVAGVIYGRDFADWLLTTKNPLEILTRLADEAGVVLLPGAGFAAPRASARISLANLDSADYSRIGEAIRAIIAAYNAEYRENNDRATEPQTAAVTDETSAGVRLSSQVGT